MPDSLITLADMVKVNDVSVQDAGVTDIFNDAPVLSVLAATTASHGTDHKYLKQTGAPVVGFRNPNAGREHSKSTDELVTLALKILDASHHQDRALADSYPGGAQEWLARESRRHLKAALQTAERQIFYGTGAQAGGFAGLADNAGLNGLSDAMVVNANADAGANVFFDVWLIRSSADNADAEVVVGRGGNIDLREAFEQLVTDANGNKFPAYVQVIEAWLGFKVGGAKSVARICNLDGRVNATTGVLTDDVLDNAFELFDSTRPPTHVVMNKRGRKQLRQSRTATRTDGASAPMPTEWEGIPIVVTDSLMTYSAKIA